MKVYNQKNNKPLHPELINTLDILREKRGFSAKHCIQAKATLLNDYMRRFKLNSCVVGLSGGLDSSVVLALIVEAEKQKNSPIKKIIPLLMPVFSRGATHQDEAIERAQNLCQILSIPSFNLDLTQAHDTLKTKVDQVLGIGGEPWAEGQLVSYIRTPALYYTTSLLTQMGLPGVICGTTNRDEGAYLGYFGKASDGMVDLQLISDLHKSEVYELAVALKIPQNILSAVPSGDMFDGRTDEEVFGAPYEFVELFILYSCSSLHEQHRLRKQWSPEAQVQFDFLTKNINHLNQYNSHKYLGKSPAVHLDVYDSGCPRGWPEKKWTPSHPTPEQQAKFVNPFQLSPSLIHQLNQSTFLKPTLSKVQKVTLVDSLLSEVESKWILDEVESLEWIPSGIDGMQKNFSPNKDSVGSYRLSTYNQAFADFLWDRVKGLFNMIYFQNGVWRAIGVNPLVRFIQYRKEGLLIPHYDAPFAFDEKHQTLISLVIYLEATGKIEGGSIHFIKDPQDEVPLLERNYDDWKEPAKNDEILFSLSPNQGSALIFEHRLLHEGGQINSGKKTILRTDIIFERCGS